MAAPAETTPAHIAHVVHLLYRFAAGGLENVLVQLISGLPYQRYHHAAPRRPKAIRSSGLVC